MSNSTQPFSASAAVESASTEEGRNVSKLRGGIVKEVIVPAPPNAAKIDTASRVTIAYSVQIAPNPQPREKNHESSSSSSDDDLPPPPQTPMEVEKFESVEVYVGADEEVFQSLVPGLNISLRSMAEGEQARFSVPATKAFPSSKPHANARPPRGLPLIYDITVKQVQAPVYIPVRERYAVKHIIARGDESYVDPFGLSCPQYGAEVDIKISEYNDLIQRPMKYEQLATVVGGSLTLEDIDCVLTSMRRGEFATVTVGFRVFKLQLAAFRNYGFPRDDEALRVANRLKDLGNDLFKERKLPKANCMYQTAISVLHERSFSEGYPNAVGVTQALSNLFGNCSLVLFEAGHYKDAVEAASRAIELAPTAYRFYFRRSKALRRMQDFTSARSDLSAVQQLLDNAGATQDNEERQALRSALAELTSEETSGAADA